MSLDTQNNPEKLPVIFAKIKGNQTEKLRKDEMIWHCQYESILKMTVAFIQVEKADNTAEIDQFEKAVKIYLTNKGFSVISTKYHPTAEALKQYLTMK